jgi:hypothetical protein
VDKKNKKNKKKIKQQQHKDKVSKPMLAKNPSIEKDRDIDAVKKILIWFFKYHFKTENAILVS